MTNAQSQEPAVGLFTDRQISAAAASGKLIVDGFDAHFLHQACYELRVGDVYYDLSDHNSRVEVDSSKPVLVKPHQTIVVISLETLSIPKDVIGRILLKGGLSTIGLHPVNTYADPGFFGRIGIILHNSSTNYIKLPIGQPIAKIAFEKMSADVDRNYVGQHGYQSQIWPIPTHLIMSRQEIQRDTRVSTSHEEVTRAYGNEIGNALNRIFAYERRLLMAGLGSMTVAIVVVAFMSPSQTAAVVAAAVGVAVNILTSVLVFLATRTGRR